MDEPLEEGDNNFRLLTCNKIDYYTAENVCMSCSTIWYIRNFIEKSKLIHPHRVKREEGKTNDGSVTFTVCY